MSSSTGGGVSPLALYPTEKIPTDFDPPSSNAKFRGDITSWVTMTTPSLLPEGAGQEKLSASIVTMIGVLIKRYVREPDLAVGLVQTSSARVGVRSTAIPLHDILSDGTIPLNEAINLVDALLAGAADSYHIEGLDLTRQAFRYDLDHDAAACRLWPHVYIGQDIPKNITSGVCLWAKPLAFGGYDLAIQYDAELFHPQTIEAMLRSFQAEAIAAKILPPNTPIDLISCLSEQDYEYLIHKLNYTHVTYPGQQPSGIQELFERSADKSPDVIAVIGPSHSKPADGSPSPVLEMKYSEVEAQANQLCSYLRDYCSVRPGGVVGILLERTTSFYIVMLATLKAGATYVSIDPEYPEDRIHFMLNDSKAAALVTTSVLMDAKHIPDKVPAVQLVNLDSPSELSAIQKESTDRPPNVTQTEYLCYIIYTSGSTGNPKGVQLSHANVINLIQAEGMIYKVEPHDRILQGFSTSFDASVEEIWMAFSNGATLVVGTKDIMRSGPDFPRFMERYGITCLSTVPTLLATLPENELQGIRLMITGGEACSRELVNRWANGRRFLNTYGPTEATVIATYKECAPDVKRVSIGRPLPNYKCYVVDQHMQPVPPGAVGELVVGGISVSRNGYLNLPQKTASVFLHDTFTNMSYPLYRTGDLVRYGPSGDIEYFGRADFQVKIRGYRVELSEIETVIAEYPGIKSVVVDLQSYQGVKSLVAFITTTQENFNTEDIFPTLKGRLPVFMVPATIQILEELPTLTSGKVERRRLPNALEMQVKKRIVSKRPWAAVVSGMSTTERLVAEVWKEVLGDDMVESTDANFFELGGHSLLVSVLVTKLRASCPSVSARDVYTNPTIRTQAIVIDQLQAPSASADTTAKGTGPAMDVEKGNDRHNKLKSHYIPSTLHALVGDIIQTLLLIPLTLFSGANVFTIYLLALLTDILYTSYSFLVILALQVGIFGGAVFVTIAMKWILLGRMVEGDYPIWGWYHIRVWFVRKLVQITVGMHAWELQGTPFMTLFLKALGCHIGPNCYIHTVLDGFDLITVGEGCCINEQSDISAVSYEKGWMKLRKIAINDRVTLSTKVMVNGDVTIGGDAIVKPMSMVPSGTVIGAGEVWAGSPAQRIARSRSQRVKRQTRNSVPYSTGFLQLLLPFANRVIESALMTPFIFSFDYLNIRLSTLVGPAWRSIPILFAFYLALSLSLFIVQLLFVKVVRMLVLSDLHLIGRCSIDSFTFYRFWCADILMQSLRVYFEQLRGTIYLPMIYRFLGAKIGYLSEVASTEKVCPDGLTIGDHSFIADDVALGGSHIEAGYLTTAPVVIGNRSFVGNGSMVPGGTELGDGCLVGLASLAPIYGEPNKTYLGSPPLEVGAREGLSGNNSLTYTPPRAWIIGRHTVEGLGFLLLHTLDSIGWTVAFIVAEYTCDNIHDKAWVVVLAIFTAIHLVANTILVTIMKWLVVWRFKEGQYPLYSFHVWRTELIERLEEGLVLSNLSVHVSGTWLFPAYFRLQGAKIGSRCYLEDVYVCEPDLITIGNHVIIESNVTLQAHLFTDRMRTVAPLKVGDYCTIGTGSIVLLNTRMEEGALLGGSSVLLRNEVLPAWTSWHGLPAQPERGFEHMSSHRNIISVLLGPGMDTSGFHPSILEDVARMTNATTPRDFGRGAKDVLKSARLSDKALITTEYTASTYEHGAFSFVERHSSFQGINSGVSLKQVPSSARVVAG